MKFTWDENKRKLNLGKHGLDFVDAHYVFEGLTMTSIEDGQDYGETRYKTTGALDIIVVTIIHTETENEIRIISMRKSTKKERRAYEEIVCV